MYEYNTGRIFYTCYKFMLSIFCRTKTLLLTKKNQQNFTKLYIHSKYKELTKLFNNLIILLLL